MACTSCKEKRGVSIDDILINTSKDKKSVLKSIKEYTIKTIVFLLLFVLIAPFIIPIFAVALFNTTILSKKVDIMPLLIYVGKKIFKKDNQDEDDDDDEEDDEEEWDEDEDEDIYELENPHEIIVLKQ